MDWIKNHVFLVGILVLLIVGATWYGMQSSTPPEALIVTDTIDGGSPSENIADRELVESLLTLRAINLSGQIFSDPVFKVLEDFGTAIVPEPVGRPNPFAPLQSQVPAPVEAQVPRLMTPPVPTPTNPGR
jgi:hypothetical protein